MQEEVYLWSLENMRMEKRPVTRSLYIYNNNNIYIILYYCYILFYIYIYYIYIYYINIYIFTK